MATMRDVARRAGVSTSTVSFVLNGTKAVSPDTLARVEKAMADLNFRPNALARALASRDKRILAIVVPALERRLSATALDVITAATEEAFRRAFTLVVWPSSNDPAQIDHYVSMGLVDGVLLMEVQSDDARVARLQELNVPFVLIGRTADPSSMAYVDMDFEAMITDSLNHLRGLGHERIALITGRFASDRTLPGYGPVVRTEQAFLTAMTEAGIQPVLVRCDHEFSAGRDVATQLLSEHPGVTALLVMNEEAAYGVVSAVKQAGRRIPEDISVMSLVTSKHAATMAEPALSAALAPGAELGIRGVAALIDLLGDGTPTRILAPCRIDLADSTGPAPVPATPAPGGNVS